MTELDYHVVDVFTDRAFAGNPLAVVLGADGLPTASLQALANEFNLSETAFALAPTVDAADYRLRIFTPTTELPFAGHPSVGSAWLLHRLGRLEAGAAVQECGAGLLPVDVGATTASVSGGPARLGAALDVAQLCGAVGLGAEVAAGPVPRWCGVGIDFAYLQVQPPAVAAAVPDLAALAALGNAGVSVFALDGTAVHARVFAAGAGVPEDPATGSAALGLGVYLVAIGALPADGPSSYVVSQGAEMGRPSTLRCTLTAAGGAVTSCAVTGEVVPVARGQITIPG